VTMPLLRDSRLLHRGGMSLGQVVIEQETRATAKGGNVIASYSMIYFQNGASGRIWIHVTNDKI
jgi:hypothetical protein